MIIAMMASRIVSRIVVVELLERREHRAADAARADDADHRRVPQVRIDLIRREADEACEHLRQHAIDHDVHERGAGRAYRFDLLQRDFLDRFGEELPDEADRCHRERENAGERAESDRLDEDDRDDHLVKGAAERDQEPHRPGDPGRHQVTRGKQPDRQRKQDSQRRSDDGDLERLVEAARQQCHLVGRRIGREHACDETCALLDADDEAVPREIEDRCGVDV